MTTDNFIKCRFCSWRVPKWKGKSGPHQAFAKLRAHIKDEHEDKDELRDLISMNEDNDRYHDDRS